MIPDPGFLPPGSSLLSHAFLGLPLPGEVLKSGVGINFRDPLALDQDSRVSTFDQIDHKIALKTPRARLRI